MNVLWNGLRITAENVYVMALVAYGFDGNMQTAQRNELG
jgi:hypothetical protein